MRGPGLGSLLEPRETLDFGNAGTGSSLDLTAQKLFQAAGIKLTNVGYKGQPPALIDLMTDLARTFNDSDEAQLGDQCIFVRPQRKSSGASEQLLRDVIEQRYLGPQTTHELTAERLHVSRSTYFRHLGVAVDRMAEFAVLARRS